MAPSHPHAAHGDHSDHSHHAHGVGSGGDAFDAQAATWDDDPAKVERARAVAEAIVAAVPLTASTRLFEYGAGTGLVSEALGGHVGAITLADTSAGMREVMEQKVAGGALPGARIWALDLSSDVPPAEQFDLIVTVMALHHIAEPDPVLAGFASLLAPGGHLCIVDLDHEDGSFHGDGFAGHHGFHRPELAGQLATAGFGDVTFADCHEMLRDGVPYLLFLAVARR